MPELPEVEAATRRLRRAVRGKVIHELRLLHPSLRRRLRPKVLRSLQRARIADVERRGKHQLLWLDDGRALHAHFRMTGDWTVDRHDDALPRFARATLVLADGTRVVLDDPRALSVLEVHAADTPPDLGLGPEPSDRALTAPRLLAALARRHTAIKPVLLDQRVIAGLGNIYAAEALWRARIHPATAASALPLKRVASLLAAIRAVIKRATGARYTDSDVSRLDVYDREDRPCRRCRTPIARITQAGRSTYFCPRCQPG